MVLHMDYHAITDLLKGQFPLRRIRWYRSVQSGFSRNPDSTFSVVRNHARRIRQPL